MQFKLPPEAQIILDKFQTANWQIYIVGGAVRDLLMDRVVTDWDFTTDAKPEEILKLFPEGFYDNKFGTVGIPIKTTPGVVRDTPGVYEMVYEITTMRKEGDYRDHRHPTDVSWTNKIEEDLGRRDFTINAIALTPRVILSASEESKLDPSVASLPQDDKWVLVDPFQGQQDIKDKLIRSVGGPDKRFKEDALRLMRAIRIAAELEFAIESHTLKAIQKSALLIKEVAWERISDELFKLLSSMNPYIGIVKLKESGILHLILPELERCFGVVQEGPKHDRVYDIGEHSLLSLKHCPSQDPLVRLATLIHDIGKPDTHAINPDGNVTFYGHDVVGARLTKKVAHRLKLSNKQTDKLIRLVRWHLFPVDERQTDSAIRRFIKNVGRENVDDMMALRVGDRLGGGTQKAVSWRMEKFRERIDQVLHKPFSVTDLKADGNDVIRVLGIKPGPKVGEILNKLFQEVLEDASKNNREYLLSRIKQLKS